MEARINGYRRILFGVVLFHFALFAIIVGMNTADNWREPHLLTFLPNVLGIRLATALWIIENFPLIWCATVAADVAAVYVVWTIACGRANTTVFVAYLSFMFGLVLIHFWAVACVTHARVLLTPQCTYEFSPEDLIIAITQDGVLGLPAFLLLVGRIVFGCPRPMAGMCPRCGYDLRASKDRCPECGTPIPSKMEVS